MSKIVKVDQEQLSNFKWRKCVLGVIHPEHTPVQKVDSNDSFSDLVITAKPAQISFKPSWVPPASVPIKREPNPYRRPKSAKPGTDVVKEALNSIPQARADRKNFFRTSMIAGKDLKNSISDYKSRLTSKRSEVTQLKVQKTKYLQEAQKIDKLLGEKFQTAKISDGEYTEIKTEVDKLAQDYDTQLHKQKIIINFLALKEDQLDLQELNRMFADIQLKKEKQLIILQHFVLRLKEETVNKARSLIAFVSVDSISKALAEFSKGSQLDREILIEFLEKVKLQLRKDGMDKDSEDFLPFGCIEKVITMIYLKWEREKEVLEGFLNDVLALFCDEFNLTKEAVVGSKNRNKRETELKVVAEFVNMYLQRLHNSIEAKIKRLEYLKQIIENGKPATVSWTQALLKYVKLDGTKPQKPADTPLKDPKNSNSKSPPRKNSRSPQRPKKNSKSPPQKDSLKKSNVGRSAQKFKPSHLSSIPEEKKKPKNSKINSTAVDDEIDDIISDLNPSVSKGKGLFGLKASGTEKNVRKAEMDSTDGLFNFRPTKVQDSREIFMSIDAPLMKSMEKPQPDMVLRSISDLESVRFPKKPPETRSEFIKSGIRPFSAYMDKDGAYFDPQERFPDIKASEIDPLDPYFLQSIGNKSPDPKTDWFIRSHHLRSYTNHPLSVNDDPNFYKAQMELGIKDEVQNAGKDLRDEAINHLERTLDDLKCEINSRKRAAYVNQFDDENRFTGHMGKVITPISQGLNVREKEGLVMHTYESILEELRARERMILNQKRMEAYEKNRPPQEKWYELKSNEFTSEMERHMNNLRPKEEHRKLLNNLAIPDLY